MEKIKKRNWTMLLYPEDPTHAAAMETLSKGGYKYVAILHDSDVWGEGESENHAAGEPKKEHWHVVLKFPQARYNTAVAKELGIKENYMEACANFDAACLYLVHANAEDKHQYDPAAAFGTLVPTLSKLLADDDEGTRALKINDIIESSPGPIGYSELLKKVVAAGLYSDLRRMGQFATNLIKEHNYEYYRPYQSNRGDTESTISRFDDFAAMTGDKDIQPL